MVYFALTLNGYALIGDSISSTLRVLILDDYPDDRALVMRELGLEYLDLYVRQITEDRAFADALEGGNFDLVITDSRLRWTDGLSVLRAVKARHPDVPVIMFTGAGSEELAAEAMQAGLDGYIRKTIQSAAPLRTAVRSALERAEARRRAVRLETRLHRLLNRLPGYRNRNAGGGRVWKLIWRRAYDPRRRCHPGSPPTSVSAGSMWS